MTREEAIDIIKCLAWHTRPSEEEIEQAIKTLEQEPCEELFDDWREAPSYAMTLEQAREAVHELRKENVKLRKEPCEDAISRQVVLKKITVLWNSNGDKDYCMETLRDFVVEMTSATPTCEPSEWQQDHAILKAHAGGANEVIDRIKEVRAAINNMGGDIETIADCLQIIDKLIAEVEG